MCDTSFKTIGWVESWNFEYQKQYKHVVVPGSACVHMYVKICGRISSNIFRPEAWNFQGHLRMFCRQCSWKLNFISSEIQIWAPRFCVCGAADVTPWFTLYKSTCTFAVSHACVWENIADRGLKRLQQLDNVLISLWHKFQDYRLSWELENWVLVGYTQLVLSVFARLNMQVRFEERGFPKIFRPQAWNFQDSFSMLWR